MFKLLVVFCVCQSHNLKKIIKNNPNLRLGYLYTNYRRDKVRIPDESLSNRPLIKMAKIKNGMENIQLLSDYISRLDYGDIRVSREFQKVFVNELNIFFGIESNKKAEEQLRKFRLDLEDELDNKVVVGARFEDFDNLAFEFAKQGSDISFGMSTNDIEKTFNYLCWIILKEQEDKQAKYSNLARSWPVLKQALRVWFEKIFSENKKTYPYWYKIFIKDVLKGSESKFRPAITKALREYKPISDKLLENKKNQEEKKGSYTFTIQNEYWYPQEYEEFPQNLCILDKFYLPKNYVGKLNETNFVEYLEKKKGKINWWFKNGDYGKNYFGIKYINSEKGGESLFYPDWIIQFSDGRIGIFDTKAGWTATERETTDKAKSLQERIEELREKFGKEFVGGIIVKEAKIWYYNDSSVYSKNQFVNDGKDWKPFEKLIQ